MKRTFKIIALCLSALVLLAVFAGCDAIDEMRSKHGILSNDKQSIIFNNQLYKRLPDVKETESFYWSASTINIYVTENDVPLLLSNTFCHQSSYDKQRDIITLSFVDESQSVDRLFYEHFTVGFDARYCNAKDYNKFMESIEKNVLDRVGFQYDIYEDEETYVTIQAGGETLSKEVLGHIENSEKMTSDTYEKLYEGYFTYSLPYPLVQCDSYAVNAQPLGEAHYDIVKNDDGEVFLVNDAESTAVKLSEKAASEVKEEYFYGYNDYTASEEYIGFSDEATDLFVIYD